ncbi:hypothetical protein [Agrococcus sp. Marseille-Q4369]|uniref:phage tail tube protein n=1 Tax=Agrococcus sp. Marseille-Q4369 TaxID=2810513 RepID=UPI001B8D2485|nr:hypothetical protein [Agrococcus sp. Marseille-Q4369]QUW18894.1 hypothetical protein JSQ78_00470 [Agrococcus sp. Marseille-Q4369]
MTLEATPGAVPQAGNFLVLWVPEGGLADPAKPTVAELTAPTVKKVTYSHKKGGYTPSKETQRLNDERLTKATVRTTRGQTTYGLESTIVFGDEEDVAASVLVEGAAGYLVERWAVPNATEIAAAQKVDVKEVTDIETFKMPPTGDGDFTKRVRPFIGEVYEDVAVVA